MMENDVIIIGGGLSGLIAAATAAKRGKKTSLLTLGAGTLTIGGGIIDILGYLDNGQPATSPNAALQQLNKEHPYHKIGQSAIEQSIQFFLNICNEEGYSYTGDLNQMQWLPTAAGTMKPTCLVPKTMQAEILKDAESIIIVGVEYLKDYYPQLLLKNLKQILGLNKKYEIVMIKSHELDGRDISTLDVARWLDTKAGLDSCIKQLRDKISPTSTLIIPPILGTQPNYAVLNFFEQQLKCPVLETVVVPPSISGIRLRSMLLNHVKKLGVRIIEQAWVVRSIVENGICKAVITKNIDRERTYTAKSFILANGGFYGGGLIAEPGRAIEPIFNIPISVPQEHDEWSNPQLFSNHKQPFAQFGIKVDESLRPIDNNGNLLLENVFIVGRNLAGCDYCFEKSGNGVVLSSGYKAAMSV